MVVNAKTTKIMKVSSLVLCVLIMGSILFSCSKKINSNIGVREVLKDPVYTKIVFPENKKVKVPNQLSAFLEKPQVFMINPEKDTTVVGAKGTSIFIHANCLTSENGELLRGTVKLELKELYSKKEMILSNKPTVSNGKLLESNGEIFLNGTSNGKNLIINCEEGISVTLATPVISDMEMWLGTIDDKGNMNWQKDSAVAAVSIDPESNWNRELNYEDYNSTVNNFLFTTKKFGWINCDRFATDTTEKVEMYIQLKNSFPKEYQTYVYVLFPDMNSVLPLYSGDGENYSATVPSGKEIKIICVSATEIRTFFDMKEIKAQKGIKAVMELQPLAKAEIEKRLEGL
jgi:hypothetical protein